MDALQVNGRRIFFFGALGGLLFGYDTGVISGAILFITEDFDLSPFLRGRRRRRPPARRDDRRRLGRARCPTASAAGG